MLIDAILVARCTLPPLVAGAAHGSRNPSFFLGPLSYILGQDGPTLGVVVVVAMATRPVMRRGKKILSSQSWGQGILSVTKRAGRFGPLS